MLSHVSLMPSHPPKHPPTYLHPCTHMCSHPPTHALMSWSHQHPLPLSPQIFIHAPTINIIYVHSKTCAHIEGVHLCSDFKIEFLEVHLLKHCIKGCFVPVSHLPQSLGIHPQNLCPSVLETCQPLAPTVISSIHLKNNKIQSVDQISGHLS